MTEYDGFLESPFQEECQFDPTTHDLPGSDSALTESGKSRVTDLGDYDCVFTTTNNTDFCPFHQPLENKNGEEVTRLLDQVLEEALKTGQSNGNALNLTGIELARLDFTEFGSIPDDGTVPIELNLQHAGIDGKIVLSDLGGETIEYGDHIKIDGAAIGRLGARNITVEGNISAQYAHFLGVAHEDSTEPNTCFNLILGEATELDISHAEFENGIICSDFSSLSISARDIDCHSKVDFSEAKTLKGDFSKVTAAGEIDLTDVQIPPDNLGRTSPQDSRKDSPDDYELEINLSGARSGESLDLRGATLPATAAHYSGLEIDGDIEFQETEFQNYSEAPSNSGSELPIEQVTTGGSLKFTDGTYECTLVLKECNIDANLNLEVDVAEGVEIGRESSVEQVQLSGEFNDKVAISDSTISDKISVDGIHTDSQIQLNQSTVGRLEITDVVPDQLSIHNDTEIDCLDIYIQDRDKEEEEGRDSYLSLRDFEIENELQLTRLVSATASDFSLGSNESEPVQAGLCIREGRFNGSIIASNVAVPGGVEIENTRLNSRVDFSKVHQDTFQLKECRLEDGLDCSGMVVAGKLSFEESRVARTADFTGASFQGEVEIQNVTFQDDCLLRGTVSDDGTVQPVFHDDVTIWRTRCRGKADFRIVRQDAEQGSGTIAVNEPTVCGSFVAEQSSLTNGDFAGFLVDDEQETPEHGGDEVPISFQGTNLSDSTFQNADLANANLENAKLRDTDLQDADLTDAELGSALLNGARISADTTFGIRSGPGQLSPIRYDRDARQKTTTSENSSDEESVSSLLNKAENVYVQIETLARNNGREQLARDCFYRKKTVRQYRYRQQLQSELPAEAGRMIKLGWGIVQMLLLGGWQAKRLLSGLGSRVIPGRSNSVSDTTKPQAGHLLRKYLTAVGSKKVLGYGERYLNLGLSAAAVILLAGLFFPFFGMTSTTGQRVTYPPLELLTEDTLTYLAKVGDAFVSGLILSVSRFVGVGGIGYSPSGVGDILAIAERGAGLLAFGLLLFIIQRRTAR